MAPARILRATALLTAFALAMTACGGDDDAPSREALEAYSVSITEGDHLLVSVPLIPTEEPFAVTGVEPVPDIGLVSRYLGFVTRCAGLCGVRAWSEGIEQQIRDAVEGTVPFQVSEQSQGTHLLLLLRVTERGREILDAGECLILRGVDLERDDGETVRLTRRGFAFLWIVTGPDRRCLEQPILQV